MLTVTTRELKQNPAAAIRLVIDKGQSASVTAHGRPTGVMMVLEGAARREWVSGRLLADQITPLNESDWRSWSDDLRDGRDEFGRDIWEDAA